MSREPTIRENHLAAALVAQTKAIGEAAREAGTYIDALAALNLAATIMAGRLAGGEDSV